VQERWIRTTEWPLTAVGAVFLAAYAWPIVDPGLSPTWRTAASAATTTAWVLFTADYVIRVALADSRWQYVRHHPIDLAMVVLPLLRPLRALRLLALLSLLNRHAGAALRGRVVVFAGGSAALVSFVASLAVLDAERASADANIVDLDDALWWALTTMTTVGYGDRFPVTDTGRLIASGLMLAGIALLGVVTATFASWLVQRVAEEEERSQTVTRQEVAELAAEVRALRAELASPSRLPGQRPPGS
jgi:voltage-gated potassium channel